MGAQTCFQAAASQTAGQSVYHPAIVCVHLRTWRPPAAALLCVPKITDTEEVTGSNPVSPTSNTPSQRCFSGRLALGSADLSARFVGLSRRHHFAFRFMLDHRVPGSCLTLSPRDSGSCASHRHHFEVLPVGDHSVRTRFSFVVQPVAQPYEPPRSPPIRTSQGHALSGDPESPSKTEKHDSCNRREPERDADHQCWICGAGIRTH
jgi:hypothetical protein